MQHTLETLDVYSIAEEFSDPIWNLIQTWDTFAKDTIGKQLARAADSISANIAEGYGRFYYKESKQFYFYARGSIQETKAWLSKCKRRNIIEAKQADGLLSQASTLLFKLNAYIKFVRSSSQHNPKPKRTTPTTQSPNSQFPNDRHENKPQGQNQ